MLHDVTALSASMAQARNVPLGILSAAAIAMALVGSMAAGARSVFRARA